MIPLIRARKKAKEERLNRFNNCSSDQIIVPYVDTLLDLEWPEEKHQLEESEIISLSSKLISGGTDTTTTALQWILANLVVILEGLRCHPPVHFVLPHAVKEDVVLNGFLIPKNGTINFIVAEMGRDPKVWENPMEFKPKRFLKTEKNGEPDSLPISLSHYLSQANLHR
ncbi:hypothetical protein K1719_000541 [Acacia pycnantha]|nr:hypothetical protein K1719_000541 [Acacia pycnantha]